MSVITRAALLQGPYDIGLVERELVCGDDEVIVENHLMGICGSDKTFYRGQLPPKTAEFRQEPKFPFYLGHESGGIVREVGAKVHEFAVGDKVIAFGWNNNFADYFKCKPWELQRVPEGMDLDLASIGEAIACGMYSGLNSGVQLGDTVVVFGAGFAGQIIAQCAKGKGAQKVVVIDILDGKLNLARRLGADVVINSTQQDPKQVIDELTGGNGADVVVEAAGSESSINLATEVVRHNGKFVWYSWITQPVTLNISRWHDDGIKFLNTCLVHHTPQERSVWTPGALRPVVQGLVDIHALITHEFKLENIREAFNLIDKDDTAIKVVLRP